MPEWGKQPGIRLVMNELLRMKPNHFRGGRCA
jgi:hypothetical protein